MIQPAQPCAGGACSASVSKRDGAERRLQTHLQLQLDLGVPTFKIDVDDAEIALSTRYRRPCPSRAGRWRQRSPRIPRPCSSGLTHLPEGRPPGALLAAGAVDVAVQVAGDEDHAQMCSVDVTEWSLALSLPSIPALPARGGSVCRIDSTVEPETTT